MDQGESQDAHWHLMGGCGPGTSHPKLPKSGAVPIYF